MKQRILLLTLSFLIALPLLVLAQGGGPVLPPPPPAAPLGGIEILAALGGGYAIKKLRDKKKE